MEVIHIDLQNYPEGFDLRMEILPIIKTMPTFGLQTRIQTAIRGAG